jgi:hypothetical protein
MYFQICRRRQQKKWQHYLCNKKNGLDKPLRLARPFHFAVESGKIYVRDQTVIISLLSL